MRMRRLLAAGAAILCLAAAAPARAGEAPRLDAGAALFVRDATGGFRPAPVVSTEVGLRVTGVLLRGRVVQRFVNPTDRWLEGVYVFPLPAGAAVDHLDLRVGERVLEGRIQEREEARREYAVARREGRRASLLEQERPNVFTVSVANLGPGETVEVALEYQELLRFADGGFRLRVPTVVGPRYVPGIGGFVREASFTGRAEAAVARTAAARVTPPVLHPSDDPGSPLRLTVELDAGVPLAHVGSPSHVVWVEERGPGRRRVETRDLADRDFVLDWRPEAGAVPRVALFSEPADEGGAYLLLLALPPQAEAAPRLDREIVFVIDVSGSMGGESIRQARAALRFALERLRAGDRFNVIAFADRPRLLFDRAVPADTANLARARAFVEGLRADGGTEMLSALEAALRSDGGAGAVRQVVFVTDGSIANEEALFAAIRRDLGRSRLFTVGIGSAPNGHFLERAARHGRGTHTFVASPAEVELRMGELLRKLESPVLSDLAIHWNDAVEAWPARVPDLYAGEALAVTARIPRFVGDVVVTGRRGGRPFESRLALEPGAPGRGIGVLFARRAIEARMEALVAGADPAAVRRDVVAIALRHHLVSRWTSLVAVDVTPARPEGEGLQQAAVPVSLPAGQDPVKVGVLPRAGTAGPLLRLMGALLLAAGVGVVRGRRRL